MSCLPSSRTIVCKEVFDENSIPSEEEVRDYAVKIGINPDSEPHLLHFARDGLMQALPAGWKPCYDEELGSWYYFNFKSGESRWEHPLDDIYRNLVRKVRSESISSAGEEDSKTSAKEDLKSYEEAASTSNAQPASHSLEPLQITDMFKKGRIQLAPLKTSPVLSPLSAQSLASPKKLQSSPLSSPAGSKSPTGQMDPVGLIKSKDVSSTALETVGRSDSRVISTRIDLGGGHRNAKMHKEIPSPTARIDIDSMDMGSLVKRSEDNGGSRKERLLSAQEKHPRSMTGRGELTLTGGGSMFLKSRQQKQEPPTATLSSPTPAVGLSPTSDAFGGIVKLVSSRDQDENLPKSILRADQQRSIAPGKTLWDIDPREMSSEEKQMWRHQELEEERKSVRFNLDQELDIHFSLSDVSDQEGVEEDYGEGDWNSDEEDPDEERLIAGIKVSDILNLMDASDLEETSAGEDVGRNKSQRSVNSVTGDKIQQPIGSGSRTDSGLSKQTKTPGAKSVNGTRFTVERVHEHVLLSSSKDSEGSFSFKQAGASTGTESYEKTDIHHMSSLVSNVIPSSNDATSHPYSVTKPEQDCADVLSDKVVKIVEEVNLTQEDGELKNNGNQTVNERSSATEGQGQVKNNMGPELKFEEAVQKEYDEQLEAGHEEYHVRLRAGQQSYQDRLAEEIKKLEQENEKVIERHREMLAQRLEESISQMETDQQKNLETLRSQLARKEEEEEVKLKLSLEEEMAAFERNLKLQQEKREKCIRENMEASLQELRDTLAVERERQIHILQQEQEQIQSQQVEQFKKRLEDDRILLEQQTLEQVAKFKKELACKMEEECANLERVHNEHVQELNRRNGQEIELMRTKLQAELTAHKHQLQQAHQQEMNAIDVQLREVQTAKRLELDEAKRRNELSEKLKNEMGQELEQKRLELAAEHEAIVIEQKAENAVQIEKLKLDFKMEEEQVRREHTEQLDGLQSRLNHELELERQRILKTNEHQSDLSRQELVENSRVFEKLRCEKRLLEDKYRSLKEKYIRLKTDIKISMERRKRRDAGGTTTGSETERSTSHKTGVAVGVSADTRGCQQVNGGGSGSSVEKQCSSRRRMTAVEAVSSDNKIVTVEPEGNNKKTETAANSKNWQGSAQLTSGPVTAKQGEDSVDSDNISSSVSLQLHKGGKHLDPTDVHNANNNRRRRQLFGRLKSASTSRLLQNNNSISGHGETCGNICDDSSCSPVENLRRQLQKLEDLEDQFPASTHTDTYLRYPFTTDSGQLGSSELEFFRHRIHLERDSVRRAKNFLRSQRTSFQSRQRELKQQQLDGSKTARSMLDQLYQEERELTDMEVSLHRTRSLLGEKIIRLRHLEQSLHRASSLRPNGQEKCESKEDATLSDLSSHSGSSGFSSTELGTDTQQGKVNNARHSGGSGAYGNMHYQESTEIIQSLENLNTEIREIWEVLNKQQKDGTSRQVVPPPLFVYPDVGWPVLVGPQTMATPSLSDRMQALHHQARPSLSAMGHFLPSALPDPQNVTAQFTAAVGWPSQGQNGGTQLTQLGTALAHQSGTAPFRTTVLPHGGGTAVTTPSLVERTRNLRDWLRQARIDSADLISPGQATL